MEYKHCGLIVLEGCNHKKQGNPKEERQWDKRSGTKIIHLGHCQGIRPQISQVRMISALY